jgi:ABC-type uncharacterized transport system ATPase subunit
MADAVPAVELRALTKRFGDVIANDGVHLRVEAGTIHALVGENGAGKSTAMKLLYGAYQPDRGEILVGGKKRVWASPAEAIATGIGMVHQHFMLAAPYSALDNILLGAEPLRMGLIARGKARAELDALARQHGLPVELDRPVEELAVGIQQRVEILKLLYRKANILILDEPTAVLTLQETAALFGNLKKLRDEGRTILLVTHKLKEVMALTDRVTVFRGGKVVGELKTSETNPQELADLMVGRRVALKLYVEAAAVGVRTGEPQETNVSVVATKECAIEVSELVLADPAQSRHRLSNVTFSVNRGEVVGIAGVEGNGQSELLQAMLHPRDSQCRTSGRVSFLGKDVTNWSAARIRDLGVAVIPEDRQREGLLLERSVRENFLLGLHRSKEFNRGGFLNFKALSASGKRAIEAYEVRPADLNMPTGKLSGGNQQKLIVAREFHREPRVLIAAQPTRGVDVGAIEFIHRRIIQTRDEGAAVLLVSSELDEILELSDRILVMFEGRVAGEFRRGGISERELGLKMGGG